MKNITTKLKKGDTVQVMKGRFSTKPTVGKILDIRVDKKGKAVVFVEGAVCKKTVRPKNQQDKGGIVDVEKGINISNVQIVCKKCGPTRIGVSQDGDNKVRKCKKCGDVL
ncbi:MAG: 50S ribosomal protein L24 [Spirochaetales bacterium]|nr:50S ribosomal protein L24 [Spirochaetales bacterium]